MLMGLVIKLFVYRKKKWQNVSLMASNKMNLIRI